MAVLNSELPKLEIALHNLTVPDLAWYASALTDAPPKRKGELVAVMLQLLQPARLRQLWGQLTPERQHIVSDIVHNLGGRYDAEMLRAKYPTVPAPQASPGGYYGYTSRSNGARPATPFDLLFYRDTTFGIFIPFDLTAFLMAFVPRPPKGRMRSHDQPPALAAAPDRSGVPDVIVTNVEPATFHDLTAALQLIQSGKAGVSATTHMPTLATARQLRQRLLAGDYFEGDYERAEDAIRPLALLLIIQAAKWATPGSNNKLELTRRGQALLGIQIGAQHVREAWESWVKNNLLDELSRIRAIRGQQSKGTRLTKPAERREKMASALRDAPLGRWVELDEFFRYLRAQGRGLAVERGETTLHIGSYPEYSWLGYTNNYWDIVIGSYLRALLFEYATTLGMIEIAYTLPEDTPHSFGDAYGLDEYDYLSRYDGLIGLRLTNLGAYVLGLTEAYSSPTPAAEVGVALLKVLPNLDIAVTDAARLLPNDRALLERIATEQSQNVFRLNRDNLLEAAESGLRLDHVRDFLASRSGESADAFPQTVRVFFDDLEKRMDALREAGRMIVLAGEDRFLLTELANTPALRTLVRLATIGEQTVLLLPEDQELAVRRQLKKLGYITRKG
jgi:hypothetical protein